MAMSQVDRLPPTAWRRTRPKKSHELELKYPKCPFQSLWEMRITLEKPANRPVTLECTPQLPDN